MAVIDKMYEKEIVDYLIKRDGGGAAHARADDPATSHEAAASVTSTHIKATQAMILRILTRFGPMTDSELLDRMRHRGTYTDSGVRTRRSELVNKKMVEDSGERRQTLTGRWSIVWRVTSVEAANA